MQDPVFAMHGAFQFRPIDTEQVEYVIGMILGSFIPFVDVVVAVRDTIGAALQGEFGWAVFEIVTGAAGFVVPLLGDVPNVLKDSAKWLDREPHGVLGVLRPYASTQEPFTIAPLLFEQGLKHHCFVDMLITVYDDMVFTSTWTEHDLGSASGSGVGRLDGAGSSWEVKADALLDVSSYPTDLNQSIHQAAAFGRDLLVALGSR